MEFKGEVKQQQQAGAVATGVLDSGAPDISNCDKMAELPTLCKISSRRPLSTHIALVVTLTWAFSCDGRCVDDTSAAEAEDRS